MAHSDPAARSRRPDRSNGDRGARRVAGSAQPTLVGTASGVGGVPLHYEVYGSSEPVIVCCNGVGVSTFFWKYVVDYFAATHRIVTWDYRGHNGSGLPAEMIPANFTIEVNARDCIAVLDACGVERAVLLGHSMGCQVIFDLWRQAPDRVAGLVPICGPYGRPLDTALGSPQVAHALFGGLYTAVNTFPEQVQSVIRPLLRSPLPMQIARWGAINATLAELEDMLPYFDHLARIDLRVFFLMFGEMQKHDAGPWLESIAAPTLVVAGEHDLLTPLDLAYEMAERIPGADLLVLPRGSHAGLIEHPELLNLRIEKFLLERVPTKARRAVSKSAAPKAKPAGRSAPRSRAKTK